MLYPARIHTSWPHKKDRRDEMGYDARNMLLPMPIYERSASSIDLRHTMHVRHACAGTV